MHLFTSFQKSSEKFQTRVFLNRINEHGKKIPSTYKSVYRSVVLLSKFLKKSGFLPGDIGLIIAKNSKKWVITDLAIHALDGISASIHATISKEMVWYCLSKIKPKFIFVEDESIFHMLPDENFEGTIVSFEKFQKEDPRDNFLFFSDIFSNNNSLPESTFHREDDREFSKERRPRGGVIVFTSGTSSYPKAVFLTHKNILSNVHALKKRVPVYAKDRFASFLPLSHMFERTAGLYTPMICGASITFVRRKETLVEDIAISQPTMLLGIPRIFEKVYEKTLAKRFQLSGIARKHFEKALNVYRKNNFFEKYIYTILFYRKIREIFGGKVRVAISGGSKISSVIVKFFIKVGIPMLQGYGLSETSPVLAVPSISSNRIGSVGPPLCNVSMKLGKFNEIVCRGDSVFAGYYQDETKTKNAFTDDGYFRTGDVGYFDKDGNLYVKDRLKEIIVLSTGKNIFPSAIENHLNLSHFIKDCMLIGEKRKFLAALIVLDFEEIKKLGKSINTTFRNTHEASSNEKIQDLIQKEIQKVYTPQFPWESIKKFTIIDRDFSQERGELTITLKKKRKIIEEHFTREIEEIYR